MRKNKLGDGSPIPGWLPSRKAIRIFLTIRQGILIIFVFIGIGMLVSVCWLMFFADPADVDFGDGDRPPWGIRLAIIGFVLFWNFLVHIFLRGNNKRLKQVKDEIRQQISEDDI